GRLKRQRPVRVLLDIRYSLPGEPYQAGVGAGGHHEVELQALLVGPVVNQVDAGKDVPVGRLGIIGDVADPARRVVAGEVVGAAGQFTEPLDATVGVGPGELHPDDVLHRREGVLGAGLRG